MLTPEREAAIREEAAESAGASWLGDYPLRDIEALLAEIDRLRAEIKALADYDKSQGQQKDTPTPKAHG